MASLIQPRNAFGPFDAEELPIDLQKVGPLVRPVFDEVWAAHQLVDQLLALELG